MTNETTTANGALTYRSTLNKVLDFFSRSGACRGNTSEYERLFADAYAEDQLLALKALFYSRDIRGGQGERANFRAAIKYLLLSPNAKNGAAMLEKNLANVFKYGRWDDLFCLIRDESGKKVEVTVLTDKIMQVIREQLKRDTKIALKLKKKASAAASTESSAMDVDDLEEGSSISLLAKWLPSENTSSKETKNLAKFIRTKLKQTPKDYRKMLSLLRKTLDVVERRMSAMDWDGIEYERVPSKANSRYHKAFKKHDPERYREFLQSAIKGEKKMNSATLHPHEIVRMVSFFPDEDTTQAAEALWQNLPDFQASPENSIVIADVSGSMNGVPMEVSIALAIYISERNKGIFKNRFITFSSEPQIQEVKGSNLAEKVANVESADFGMSTNFNATFEKILDLAKKYKLSQEGIPQKVYCISDMQFDEAEEEKTNFESIKGMYEAAGYKMPQLVFWNVNGSSDSPATFDQNGTFLVSGFSPSILKHVVNCEANNPLDLMLEVLQSERYQSIVCI